MSLTKKIILTAAGIAVVVCLVITGVRAQKVRTVRQSSPAPGKKFSPSKAVVPSSSKKTVSSPPPKQQTATISPRNPDGVEKDFRSAANQAIERKNIRALQNVLNEWVEKDFTGFVEWAGSLPKQLPSEGNEQFRVLSMVARSWVNKDPAAASQWAGQLPEGQTRNLALASVIRLWANKDPAAAVQLAGQLPEGQVRNSALADVAGSWANKDPVAAAQLAGQLPEGDVRNRTLSNIARSWAGKDPAAATAWAESLPSNISPIVDQQIINAQISPLVNSEENFQNVVTVVQELPSNLQEKAMEEVVMYWSLQKKSDQAQTDLMEWLKNQPAGDSKDRLIGRLSGQNYLQKLELISQISNEKTRQLLTEFTLRYWGKESPETARQWLDQSPLSEETKTRLRKTLEKKQ